MSKKILASTIIIVATITYIYFRNSKNEFQNLDKAPIDIEGKNSEDSQNNKLVNKFKTAFHLNNDNNKKDEKDISRNHNTIHNNKLKIEDFIIAIEQNEKTDSLKSILTQFSTISLENTTLKDLKSIFEKIDIETELSVDRNESTGNMFFLKSKSNIPGTRYLHGQIVGEGAKKFVQHLSFEYKSESNSFKEAVTFAQSLIGTDQKPSVISENYIQWKISETHILSVKNQSLEELLDDPIYPHSEEDLGTVKIVIEQEIH